MQLTKTYKSEILEKKKKLDQLKAYLKEEFVGIDNIIEGVVDAMMPFYLFPKSLTRPIVINLWGMTGTGKTSLVEKIVEFLKLNNSYLKFDIGEYSGERNGLKSDLSYKTSKMENESNVLVFDEFQLGRTIDEYGKEVDKNTLRPLWELLDSGIIYVQNTHIARGVLTVMKKIELALNLDLEVDERGFISRNADIYENIVVNNNYCRPVDYEECYCIDEEKKKSLPQNIYDRMHKNSSGYIFNKPFFMKLDWFNYLYEANPEYFKNVENFEYHRAKFTKPLKDQLTMIDEIMENISIMEKKDYSKSLIFCLGNLDEVYQMSHNVNPDEDADVFHEYSLKISMPEVKHALSKRFRMEQIGRLGNSHFIYPSLNKNSYEVLVEKQLTKTKKFLKDTFQIDLVFHKSINDILYKEGVYPTQGTRPLFSTFNTMINSHVSKLMTDICLDFDSVEKIEWRYDKHTYYIKASSKKQIKEFIYPVDCILEKMRESDNSEIQALVAVHESGHALVACLKLGIAPSEVMSKTASVSEGLCKLNLNGMLHTRDYLYKEIMVNLAGMEAEKLIFGKDLLTAGSTSDLSVATNIAFRMIKRYGMGGKPFILSAVTDESQCCAYVKSEDYEKEVENILKKAKSEVKTCLKKHKKHLLVLSNHLATKPKIQEAEIKEMLSELNIDWKSPGNYYDFRGKLAKIVTEVVMA